MEKRQWVESLGGEIYQADSETAISNAKYDSKVATANQPEAPAMNLQNRVATLACWVGGNTLSWQVLKLLRLNTGGAVQPLPGPPRPRKSFFEPRPGETVNFEYQCVIDVYEPLVVPALAGNFDARFRLKAVLQTSPQVPAFRTHSQ